MNMKKVSGLLVALLVIVLGIAYMVYGTSRTPRVFQTPYKTQVQTEFQALLEANNQEVADSKFWTTPVNGQTAQEVLEEKATKLYHKYQLLEKKARETTSDIAVLDLETVEWKELSAHYTQLKQIVIDERLSFVTYQEAEQYYAENREQYARQATISGQLATWRQGMIVAQESFEISEENIRMVTELYPDLEYLLEGIQAGQQVVWNQAGDYYTFTCDTVEDKGIQPLSDIIDAVATQYAEQQVDDWLERES